MRFCRLLIFFSKSTFLKSFFFRNSIRVSNSLDLDQTRHLVGPDLCPNCLQRLSVDGTSRQRVNKAIDKKMRQPFLSFIENV